MESKNPSRTLRVPMLFQLLRPKSDTSAPINFAATARATRILVLAKRGKAQKNETNMEICYPCYTITIKLQIIRSVQKSRICVRGVKISQKLLFRLLKQTIKLMDFAYMISVISHTKVIQIVWRLLKLQFSEHLRIFMKKMNWYYVYKFSTYKSRV